MEFPREIFYDGRVMLYDYEDVTNVYYRCISVNILYCFQKEKFFSNHSIAIISP